MVKYFVRRLLVSIPVLIGVTIIIFTLIELAPGDVADVFIGSEGQSTPEMIAQIRAQFGLDQPAPVRYVRWVGNVLRGDLGYSFINGRSVLGEIERHLGATLLLGGTALMIGIIAGVALGVFVALRQYSFWDFSFTGLSFLGISMPAFVTGIIGLYLFATLLHLFPAGGMRPVDHEPTLIESMHYLILPSLILSLGFIANFMRYTRFSMLEVIHSDYVRTARAKGLHIWQINWRHAFPNAILPVITVVGLSLSALVVGALFTETIFSWPGMGSLYLDAVSGRDVPLLMGINLVVALAILGVNILTDLAYAIVDPRIRYD